MTTEVLSLSKELRVGDPELTSGEAITMAAQMVNGLLNYARQWDSEQAKQRAAAPAPARLTRENAFPAWATRARPDDLFKDED